MRPSPFVGSQRCLGALHATGVAVIDVSSEVSRIIATKVLQLAQSQPEHG